MVRISRRLAALLVVIVLALALALPISQTAECATDICTKTGPGSPYDTCHGWQSDLLNACAAQYPNGGLPDLCGQCLEFV